MGIWIRSQDKKRLKFVSDISLQNTSRLKTNTDNLFDYEYYNTEVLAMSYKNTTLLGVYHTEERAIEVLDEIQNPLIKASTPTLIFNSGDIPCKFPKDPAIEPYIEKSSYIPSVDIMFYQMPTE